MSSALSERVQKRGGGNPKIGLEVNHVNSIKADQGDKQADISLSELRSSQISFL